MGSGVVDEIVACPLSGCVVHILSVSSLGDVDVSLFKNLKTHPVPHR